MELKYLSYEMTEKGIVIVTLQNPPLNLLSVPMAIEIRELFVELSGNPDVRCVILTGSGPKAFCAGNELGAGLPAGMPVEMRSPYYTSTFGSFETCPAPVIAAINGYALGGGCERAMSCDIRIGSDKAKFGMPEVGLGITPGFGGTQRLQRIVGMSTAMELVLTSRTIDAQEALRIGLINHLYPAEEMLDRAIELASIIASKAQVAVRQAKQAIRIGKQIDMSSAIAFEAEAFGLCFSTEDQKDAMQAFLNKEKLLQLIETIKEKKGV